MRTQSEGCHVVNTVQSLVLLTFSKTAQFSLTSAAIQQYHNISIPQAPTLTLNRLNSTYNPHGTVWTFTACKKRVYSLILARDNVTELLLQALLLASGPPFSPVHGSIATLAWLLFPWLIGLTLIFFAFFAMSVHLPYSNGQGLCRPHDS